jgi:hypothetical protein
MDIKLLILTRHGMATHQTLHRTPTISNSPRRLRSHIPHHLPACNLHSPNINALCLLSPSQHQTLLTVNHHTHIETAPFPPLRRHIPSQIRTRSTPHNTHSLVLLWGLLRYILASLQPLPDNLRAPTTLTDLPPKALIALHASVNNPTTSDIRHTLQYLHKGLN